MGWHAECISAEVNARLTGEGQRIPTQEPLTGAFVFIDHPSLCCKRAPTILWDCCSIRDTVGLLPASNSQRRPGGLGPPAQAPQTSRYAFPFEAPIGIAAHRALGIPSAPLIACTPRRSGLRRTSGRSASASLRLPFEDSIADQSQASARHTSSTGQRAGTAAASQADSRSASNSGCSHS